MKTGVVNVGTTLFSLLPFFLLPPHLLSPSAEFLLPLSIQATKALTTMATTKDHGKMPIVLFGEDPSNHPNTHPESQTTIMAVDVLEVELLAIVPPVGGQLGAIRALGDPKEVGRPCLNPPAYPALLRSLYRHAEASPSHDLGQQRPRGLPRANWGSNQRAPR